MLKEEKIINVRNVSIGKGMPKVCVPIMARTEKDLYEKAETISPLGVDMVEWRVDYMELQLSNDKLVKYLAGLRERLTCPILFTCRTGNEGGARSVNDDYYLSLNRGAINSGLIDLIDIEAYFNKAISANLIELAKERGVYVIVSNHDTQKTPEKEELIRRLLKMEEMGADIAKIAVMPKDKGDVVVLMQTSVEACEELKIPMICISMGRLGLISRLEGEFTGSAITYAAYGIENTLGQATAEDQMKIMALIHKYSEIVK